MATPSVNIPHNLPEHGEKEQVALAEGHDRDFPLATKQPTTDVEKLSDLDNGVSTTSVEGEEDVDKTSLDPNQVDWDGPTDDSNPMNWTSRKKWRMIALISAMTFASPLGSTIFAPGVPQVMADFGSNNVELASFMVSVYILGFAFGPIIIAPLSELYGRVLVVHISNVFFIIFTVACAVASDMGMFVTFRFFMGVFGATPLTVGGGIIADLMPPEKRGGAMAIWALGPIMGPIIGPIAGGYMAESIGWRWIFWVLAIIIAVISIFAVFFLRETYAVTLLERKTNALRKSTNNPHLYSKLDLRITPRQLFLRSIVRPTKMLTTQPIVLMMSLLMSVIYGYLYLLFTTFTFVFEQQYGFTPGQAGLVYLGLGCGSFFGLIIFGTASDKILKYQAKKHNGVFKPEYRLPPLIPGGFLVPAGLFWYGWSAQAHTHWIVPILGSGLVGLGLMATFMSTQTYVVDAFPRYAASATAAMTILRSAIGAVLPLAGQSMYAALGLGWGNSLLGFIALASIPIPFIFIRYGERIRTNPRFAIDL